MDGNVSRLLLEYCEHFTRSKSSGVIPFKWGPALWRETAVQ
jgi:hypothetical protein